MRKQVDNVVSSCSQSVHVLRILRADGMTASSVHIDRLQVGRRRKAYTQLAHGGATRRLTTENDYKLSSAVASDVSVNSATKLLMKYWCKDCENRSSGS